MGDVDNAVARGGREVDTASLTHGLEELRRWVALLLGASGALASEHRSTNEQQLRVESQATLAAQALDEMVTRQDALWRRLRAVDTDIETLALRGDQIRGALAGFDDVISSQRQILTRERQRSLPPAEDLPERKTSLDIVEEGVEAAESLIAEARPGDLDAELADVRQRLQSTAEAMAETDRSIASMRTVVDNISRQAKRSRESSYTYLAAVADAERSVSEGESAATQIIAEVERDLAALHADLGSGR